MNSPTSVCLVDDHSLIRKGMAEIVDLFEGYTVAGQASNGKEFIEMVQAGFLPEIVILDIQMPVMNGEETAKWITKHKPEIKILVVTMHDDETNIIRMVRAGLSGYILKDAEPEQLKEALDAIRSNGVYHSELVNGAFRKIALGEQIAMNTSPHFTAREKEFIMHACSELTYKEIAIKMNCSVRTIDGHRDDIFTKLGIKSRVGLALFALKTGMMKM
jgi:two-component system, NarL family, invasion response regulator UvrY